MLNERKIRNENDAKKRLESLWWAGVLIWAGLVFAADILGILPQIGDADAWSWVFFGAGLYGILGNLYRLSSVEQPNPTGWDYIWSGFFLIVGLGGVTEVDIFWTLVLVILGVGIMVGAIRQRDLL